jgi:hypothetical protein
MKVLLYLFLTLFFLSGCTASLPPQSVSERPLTMVASIDASGLFAADRGGHKLAIAREGLFLLDLASNTEQKISSEQPTALAWSTEGLTLAAAFSLSDYETLLVLYSEEGQLLRETLLPVALTQMVWSARGELLATGFALKIYSFGGNLRQVLYRVDAEPVKETALSDTTLKPSTVKQLSTILQSFQPVAFSPSGDELVYVQLHDPPEFPPYMQLFYRNWQVGDGRSLQKQSLQALQLDWDTPGDSVMITTAEGVRKLALWPTAETASDLSGEGIYHFVNGRLYDGEKLLSDWGAGAQLQILPDGNFLLAVKKGLYLGDGLRVALSVESSERNWTLRRWRFEGLITPGDYQKLLQEDK